MNNSYMSKNFGSPIYRNHQSEQGRRTCAKVFVCLWNVYPTNQTLTIHDQSLKVELVLVYTNGSTMQAE